MQQHQVDPTVVDSVRQRFQSGELAAESGFATLDDLHRDRPCRIDRLRLLSRADNDHHVIGLISNGRNRPEEKGTPCQLEVDLVFGRRHPIATSGGEDNGAGVTQGVGLVGRQRNRAAQSRG